MIKGWRWILTVLLLAMLVSTAMAQSACTHNWVLTGERESTCTLSGWKRYECSLCQFVRETPTDVKEHKWECTYTRKSTCLEPGYEEYTCKACNQMKRVELELGNHTYGKWTVTREATCSEKGQRVRYCRLCGEDGWGSIAKLPHTFSAWVVTREATDRSMGVEERACTVCRFLETREFYPQGTLYEKMDKNDAVYALQEFLIDQGFLSGRPDGSFGKNTREAVRKYQQHMGYEETGVAYPQTLTALFCQKTDADGKTVMTHTPHVYGDWTILTAATTSAPGQRAHTCLFCPFTCEEIYYPEGTLLPGTEGSDEVAALQQLLIDHKIIRTIADGDYGPRTELGVRTFQQMAGLEETGIAYPETIEALKQWQAK